MVFAAAVHLRGDGLVDHVHHELSGAHDVERRALSEVSSRRFEADHHDRCSSPTMLNHAEGRGIDGAVGPIVVTSAIGRGTIRLAINFNERWLLVELVE
jgi:hypothetical protein